MSLRSFVVLLLRRLYELRAEKGWLGLVVVVGPPGAGKITITTHFLKHAARR